MNPIDWGDDPREIKNAAGSQLFNRVDLEWTKPVVWPKSERVPHFETGDAFVYALTRDHGNSYDRDRIEYTGLTTSPETRFGNHEVARRIVRKPGIVKFSYAPIETRGRNQLGRIKFALEQIEHLLIWALWDHLENDKKQFTLPGMGVNGGKAWHIVNHGYRFLGRMPREIIYPWMLARWAQDRSGR